MHDTGQYENNRVECDHGRLKAGLRPMRSEDPSNDGCDDRGTRVHPESWPRPLQLAVDATPSFRLAGGDAQPIWVAAYDPSRVYVGGKCLVRGQGGPQIPARDDRLSSNALSSPFVNGPR